MLFRSEKRDGIFAKTKDEGSKFVVCGEDGPDNIVHGLKHILCVRPDFVEHVSGIGTAVIFGVLYLQQRTHDGDAAEGGAYVVVQVGGDFKPDSSLFFQMVAPVQVDGCDNRCYGEE